MCINKEVSFLLALFGIFCSIKEFRKETLIDNLKGVCIIVLVLMQLNELGLHVFTNPKTTMHQIFSILIPVVLVIQVISLLIASIILPTIDKGSKIAVIVSSTLYLVCALYLGYTVVLPSITGKTKPFDSRVMCKEGCRLKWGVSERCDKSLVKFMIICYLIPFSILTYYIFGYEILIVLLCLILVSWVIARLTLKPTNSFGSLWCLLTIIVICGVIINN